MANAEEAVDRLHGLAPRRPGQEGAGDRVRGCPVDGFRSSRPSSRDGEDDEQPAEHVVARRRQPGAQPGEGADSGRQVTASTAHSATLTAG